MTQHSQQTEVLTGDDNGPANWLLDPIKGWPKCDHCGIVMFRDVPTCEPHVFACECAGCGKTLSFDSCRRGHRYCAWVRLEENRWD